MRRSELEGTASEAMELFARVGLAHLVVPGPEVRPVHPILHEGRVYFHGAPKGEKAGWTGRSGALVAHEIVAEIPSTFRHPEKACPATTYYRSAEARGPLVEISDPGQKTEVLAAMMVQYQPEGGYTPLDADSPLYRASIRGVKVWQIDAEPVCRSKLGQGLSDAARHTVQQGLWARGDRGDDAAIEAIQTAANGALPGFLRGPGVRLLARVSDGRVDEAVALVRDQYWNTRWDDESIARAQIGAAAWVGALDGGRLIATARALSDGGKMSYIADVAVHESYRGRGIGSAVIRLLCDHASLRRTRWTALHTRGSEAFYEQIGFERFAGPPNRSELRVFRAAWDGDEGRAPEASSASSGPR